ncbi:ADP-ribosylglycohydrolase family protein [Deinococcus murrayi]|uniref:ADP-ribosylglycohydrolase family protein n=1 Tax=Deinococcus murrayi TaxID=68910 RepID=UPI00048189B3|nr:ADP-ribosylglycohydrolase family protein [Deinococcus murrayi]
MSPRALPTLLSLTAADALGAATEFRTPEAIRARYGDTFTSYQPGSVFGFAPGEATDDSQMVAATLRGYARGEGLPGVLAALREWLGTAPPDVGGLTRAALREGELEGGTRAWTESGHQSAGNGGLMRIAAVWLAGFRGAALERMDRLDARAALLDAGLLGLSTRPAHDAFREGDRAARSEVRARVRSGLLGHVTSQSGYVLDTLEAAAAHARADSWLACVEPAVLRGDDSDTVACVAGAVAGARGLEVPPHLLPPLRLGHSWPGWERGWSCLEHFPALLEGARAQPRP